MLPIIAAGMFSIITLGLQLPVIIPLNGIGVGVGTGPPGLGTMMMWVSWPMTWSPCLAAGGIGALLLVLVDP